MKYNSFQTPERRLLGAGPTNLYPEISKSLTKPEVGHLDPKFVEMMDEVKFNQDDISLIDDKSKSKSLIRILSFQ